MNHAAAAPSFSARWGGKARRLATWMRLLRNWPVRVLERHGWREGEIDYRLRCGLTIRLRGQRKDSDSQILWDVFVNRPYTIPETAIRPGDTVVDVGAHAGIFACWAARAASGVRVYAYEPSPESFRYLEHNVRANALANVRCMNLGMSEREGAARLYRSGRDTGSHSLFPRAGLHDPADFTEVRLTTLEAAIRDNNLDRIDLLKLDCEGAEFGILFGASPDLLRRVRRLAVECHFKHVPHTREELSEHLSRQGFRTCSAPRGSVLWAWREDPAP
ncbi:MAG: FkbM family methyltransferase [Planctomycetes bacterium]|nr:FkbM family methyltransferase [Planctomycetota bacterium]